ncbi:FISUMP domain-containing protein [Acidobacteriota bacterium]
MKRCISLITIVLSFLPIAYKGQHPEAGTVRDIEGNVYQMVKIGKQWWMDGSLLENAQGIAPASCHIPSSQDWEELGQTLGEADKVAEQIKVSDSTGFNAVLSSGADFKGSYLTYDISGMFWNSTASNEERAFHMGIREKTEWKNSHQMHKRE